jgi:hypothetical protein
MRQRVVRSLSMASARAGAVKVALLDGASEYVRDNASTFVLGLAGDQAGDLPDHLAQYRAEGQLCDGPER